MSEHAQELNDEVGLNLKMAQAAFGDIKGKLTGHDRTALTRGLQSVTAAQTTQAQLSVALSEPQEPGPVDPGPPGAVVYVPAGGNLQSALDAATGGTVIELEARAKYPGPYTLRNHGSGDYVTVRTRGQQRSGRTARADAPALAQIISTAMAPPLKALPGAHHWRFEDVTVTQDVGQTWSLLEIGRGEETSYDQVPHHFILDRCALMVPDQIPIRRGVALNAFDCLFRDTAIWNIKEVGFDTQAIGGRLGGRHRFENCELEAAGENIMFGGSPASIVDAMVRDVVIDGCALPKNPRWNQASPDWDGSAWQIKNNFEIKAGERIKVLNTTMAHCWRQAQDGCAVLLTVRSEYGVNPWATIRDILFENVTITGVGNGFQFLSAEENYPSVPARDWTFRNIYVEASIEHGGNGRIMEGSPIESLTLDNVVGITDGSSAYYFRADQPSASGFVFRNSAWLQNTYGFWTDGVAFDKVFPGATWSDIVVGGASSDYPPPKPSTVIPVEEYLTRYKRP